VNCEVIRVTWRRSHLFLDFAQVDANISAVLTRRRRRTVFAPIDYCRCDWSSEHHAQKNAIFFTLLAKEIADCHNKSDTFFRFFVDVLLKATQRSVA